MRGLDFSGGRPRGSAIKQAGYGFVIRYLDNGLSGRVNLIAAEVQDLNANGVAVAVVWERKIIGQPDRATAGWDAGVADARAADVQATKVGLAGWPIYMAVDFDIPDYAPGNVDPRAKLGPVGDYLAGALSVLGMGRMGVYGGFYAVSRALDAGLVEWAWQTMAWSGGQVDKRAHVIQLIGSVYVDGVECDLNESKQDAFGQSMGVDDMGPEDLISPDGLYKKDPNGQIIKDANGNPVQVTDKAKNFWGYADEFAQENKAISLANSAKLDLILQHMDVQATADQQRDAEILAAVKAVTVAAIDPTKVAEALTAAGLPQAVVQQLLAVLAKAGATSAG